MRSKWFDLKEKAIAYRKHGFSIKRIETKLGIPRSTLSGWLKNVSLTEIQKRILKKSWRNGLILARKKAVLWHNEQKAKRLHKARIEADDLLSRVDVNDKDLLDVAVSFLYLGEGFKKETTALGNSDPLILQFFIAVMTNNYGMKINQIKCELHLRADQNPEKMKKYWSRILKIPLVNFTAASIDKRTIGRKTYPHYKGVCVLRCANVAIQRKLIYFSDAFCRKVIEGSGMRAVSSVGRAFA
ncbi:MAG: hypothetical protein Q7S34_03405 [bacterium]|nr:hypothetical protein [bacterium]